MSARSDAAPERSTLATVALTTASIAAVALAALAPLALVVWQVLSLASELAAPLRG